MYFNLSFISIRSIMFTCIIFVVITCWIIYLKSTFVAASGVKDPLILTSLLKSGKIDEARKKSEVPPILPNIYSNAGFFNVNHTYNSNLFFWFFRKSNDDWYRSPLLLWLSGGSGAAFMFAVFVENGPFILVNEKIIRRKYSWINNYNLLYIDQPAGSGYSFTDSDDGFIKTIDEGGPHVYEALLQFYTLYPELRNNKFYVTCESNGCNTGIAVMDEIHKQKQNSESSINLVGIFAASGFIDPISDFEFSDHSHKMGLIDFQTKRKFRALEEQGEVYVRAGLMKKAGAIWRSSLEFFKNKTFGLNHNNIIDEKYGRDHSYVQYVISENTRERLHVGDAVFNMSSSIVFNTMINDHFKSHKPKIEKLLETYSFLIASGQLDILISPSSNLALLKNLRWSGTEMFNLAERKRWYVNDTLVGYYIKAGNLLNVFMRDAGHMFTISKPRYTLELLNRFINDGFQ